MRRDIRSQDGVALLEAAIVLPFLVVMMLNLANFGLYIHAWVTLDSAARALMQSRIYTGVVLGFPPRPSPERLQEVVDQEVAWLPNHSTVKWRICATLPPPEPDVPATSTCSEGDGADFTPESDPGGYALYAGRVEYYFVPLFSSITPLSEGKISRDVSMRSME